MRFEDVVIGFPLGHVARPPRVPAEPPSTARAAMEAVVLRALRRSPCVVAFSGGRDSSTVLAVAVTVARREGLPEPIPVSRVFPGVAAADESAWQELVIRHLGMREWVREELDDELDVVGPLAAPRLLRHGVLWSPLLHGDAVYLRHARGGSVLDGEGGDDVCDPRPHRVTPLATLLRRAARPSRARVRAALAALAPGRVRGARAGRRGLPAPQPWLRPPARALLAERWRAHVAAQPLDARRSILHVLARRAVTDLAHNRAFFARANDTLFCSPFLTPRVAAALAAAAGRLGFTDRGSGLATAGGDLLPPAVLARRTKAEFNATFFHRHTRAFAEQWSGAGVDSELVDVEALRSVWRGPRHNALSAALLQTAWLADNAPPAPPGG
jgi:asparagine synthetase B (glutamine-hydrolysing)